MGATYAVRRDDGVSNAARTVLMTACSKDPTALTACAVAAADTKATQPVRLSPEANSSFVYTMFKSISAVLPSSALLACSYLMMRLYED